MEWRVRAPIAMLAAHSSVATHALEGAASYTLAAWSREPPLDVSASAASAAHGTSCAVKLITLRVCVTEQR